MGSMRKVVSLYLLPPISVVQSYDFKVYLDGTSDDIVPRYVINGPAAEALHEWEGGPDTGIYLADDESYFDISLGIDGTPAAYSTTQRRVDHFRDEDMVSESLNVIHAYENPFSQALAMANGAVTTPIAHRDTIFMAFKRFIYHYTEQGVSYAAKDYARSELDAETYTRHKNQPKSTPETRAAFRERRRLAAHHYLEQRPGIQIFNSFSDKDAIQAVHKWIWRPEAQEVGGAIQQELDKKIERLLAKDPYPTVVNEWKEKLHKGELGLQDSIASENGCIHPEPSHLAKHVTMANGQRGFRFFFNKPILTSSMRSTQAPFSRFMNEYGYLYFKLVKNPIGNKFTIQMLMVLPVMGRLTDAPPGHPLRKSMALFPKELLVGPADGGADLLASKKYRDEELTPSETDGRPTFTQIPMSGYSQKLYDEYMALEVDYTQYWQPFEENCPKILRPALNERIRKFNFTRIIDLGVPREELDWDEAADILADYSLCHQRYYRSPMNKPSHSWGFHEEILPWHDIIDAHPRNVLDFPADPAWEDLSVTANYMAFMESTKRGLSIPTSSSTVSSSAGDTESETQKSKTTMQRLNERFSMSVDRNPEDDRLAIMVVSGATACVTLASVAMQYMIMQRK